MQADLLDTATLTRERLLAACMPNLGLVLCVFTLGYVLFLFNGWRQLFRDSDAGWHVRAGEAILLNRVLPRADPYSFSRAGAPWLDWEWASDVLAGAAHEIAGLAGVALLFAAGIAACTWLWIELTWKAGGDFLLACLLAAPMLSTVNMHWLARPHVFGWVMLLVWILWMERRRGLWGSIWIGAVWANLHASFFLAPLIALLYAGGCALAPSIWDVKDDRGSRWYLKAALLAALGTLINPYGIRLHQHVAAYLSDTELLSHVGEFQSFNFHVPGSSWILLTIGVCGLGTVLAIGARRLDHFFVSMFFIAVALRSARGLPMLALCVLPIANASITQALRRMGQALGPRRLRVSRMASEAESPAQAELRPWLRDRVNAVLAYSARLRELDRGLSGWALIPLLLFAFAFLAGSTQAGFPPDQFPVAAADAVSRLPLDARLFAPDKFGGYLIYRFHGQRKVFFDGRSDFYGAAFMKQYLRLLEVRPGWNQTLAQYHFTHALLPNDYSLVAALGAAGWKQIYQDATATLLAAPGQ